MLTKKITLFLKRLKKNESRKTSHEAKRNVANKVTLPGATDTVKYHERK